MHDNSLVWRNSDQLESRKAALLKGLGLRKAGRVELSVILVNDLIEIIDQAIHTERGHEQEG